MGVSGGFGEVGDGFGDRCSARSITTMVPGALSFSSRVAASMTVVAIGDRSGLSQMVAGAAQINGRPASWAARSRCLIMGSRVVRSEACAAVSTNGASVSRRRRSVSMSGCSLIGSRSWKACWPAASSTRSSVSMRATAR